MSMVNSKSLLKGGPGMSPETPKCLETNQEDSVADLMSEVCHFLKEIKSRVWDPLRSLVQIQVIPRACTEHRALSFLIVHLQ